MRIKDYADTIRHLTDPFNIPEARRMIQENPALTQEQFKAGGIVEQGVTNYAKKDILPKVSKIGRKVELRTPELSREELLGKDVPSRKKGISGDKLKWYNDFHFNNPESPYHNITWEDLPGKRFGKDKKIQWASKELNDRYKTHVNQIQEYNKLTKQGWVPAAEYFEKNGIDNWKLQALTREKHLSRNQWFNKNIKIKKLTTAVGGASRSYWIKEPEAKITKDFVKQFSVSDQRLFKDTQKNISELWSHKPFRNMYLNGSYPTIKEVSAVSDMTNSQAATATRRIAQLLGGTTFSNVQYKKIPFDKKAAKGMLTNFSKEKWETPYAHANRRIDTAILEENLRPYKGKLTLQTYRRRALEILKNNDIPIMHKQGNKIIKPGFNINEITGLSSAAEHQTFTSSQFINLMEGQLNQEGHARLMREYKKYEGLLNDALTSKKGTVYHKFWKQEGKEYTARELINKWKQYRTNWTDALPAKLRSSIVKSGLPGFSLGEDAASKLFGQKRLNQLVNDFKLPIVKEMEQKGYLKTWGEELGLKKQQKLMRETPVLKELVDDPDNAIRLIKKVGCPGKAAGGRVGFAETGSVNCFNLGREKIRTGQIKPGAEESNFKKLIKAAKGVRGVARATGLGLAWEAAFAPIIVGWMGSQGESWERMKHELVYGSILEGLGVPAKYVPGESAEEELTKYMGKDAFDLNKIYEMYGKQEIVPDWDPSGRAIREQYTPGERDYLQMELNAEINKGGEIGGKPGRKTYKQYQIEQQIKKLDEKGRPLIESFYEGPVGQHFAWDKAEAADQALEKGLAELEEVKKTRKEKSLLFGDRLDPTEQMLGLQTGGRVSYFNGGIAGLLKK